MKYKVGDIIVSASSDSYVGEIIYISKEEDTVRHRCRKTGTEYEKSYFGFQCRYMSVEERLKKDEEFCRENIDMHRQLIALERERDEARRNLGEILAVIHRDGGHYTGEHGISKSVADAHAAWAAVILEREQLKEKLSALREKCARICDLEFAANWNSSAMAAANAAKRCAELIRADNEETKCDD